MGMKYAALLLCASALTLKNSPSLAERATAEYPAWMHGFGGYHQYMRDVPDRYEEESDDTLMRSMYQTYATEGKTEGWPDGHFWVYKKDAFRAAHEVVTTHLKISRAEADAYLKDLFPQMWARSDVNGE